MYFRLLLKLIFSFVFIREPLSVEDRLNLPERGRRVQQTENTLETDVPFHETWSKDRNTDSPPSTPPHFKPRK